jgi:WD40 repeat protein
MVRYRMLARLAAHTGRVFSARFVSGGSAIVTAGADGTARMWNSESGELRQTYRGSPRFLGDVALTPDGAFVVAGGGDGLLRFWDAASGRQLWKLQAHRSSVIGIHVDGDDIVTRGQAGEFSRWTLPRSARIIEAASTK